jgi:hypothetical protein
MGTNCEASAFTRLPTVAIAGTVRPVTRRVCAACVVATCFVEATLLPKEGASPGIFRN